MNCHSTDTALHVTAGRDQTGSSRSDRCQTSYHRISDLIPAAPDTSQTPQRVWRTRRPCAPHRTCACAPHRTCACAHAHRPQLGLRGELLERRHTRDRDRRQPRQCLGALRLSLQRTRRVLHASAPRSVLGSWVVLRRIFHLSLCLIASRMVLTPRS